MNNLANALNKHNHKNVHFNIYQNVSTNRPSWIYLNWRSNVKAPTDFVTKTFTSFNWQKISCNTHIVTANAHKQDIYNATRHHYYIAPLCLFSQFYAHKLRIRNQHTDVMCGWVQWNSGYTEKIICFIVQPFERLVLACSGKPSHNWWISIPSSFIQYQQMRETMRK